MTHSELYNLRRAVLAKSIEHIGMGETPNGSNRGLLPDAANTYVGAPLGSPWCAAGACLMLHEGGVKNGPKTASSGGIAEWGKFHHAIQTNPSFGDMGEVKGDSATGYVHTVVIEGGTPEALRTIEFNEGNTVRRNVRHLDELTVVNPFVMEV